MKNTNKAQIIEKTDVTRCGWVSKDQLYIDYHDQEWGVPRYDSFGLFEMLCLGGQQAGLSWFVVLKKRKHYQKLFHKFNPHEISKLTEGDVKQLMNNPNIIRNKKKIESLIHSAKCFIKMEHNEESFSNFIWSFVNNIPIVNHWCYTKDVPTESELSAAMSKALKKRGFKFVGSTICYAFMQSVGLINDHLVDCICYNKT